MNTAIRAILLTVLAWLIISPVDGQRDPVNVDLSSPYHAMLTHLHYLQEDTEEPMKSAAVVDPQLDSLRRIQIARRIKKLYDGQGLYVYLSNIPDDPDYRDSTSRRHVYTPFPERMPAVYLERYDSSWYYSEETVDRLEVLYREAFPFGTHRLVDSFAINQGRKVLGLHGWQYMGLLVLLLILVCVYFLVAKIIYYPIAKVVKRYLELSPRGLQNLRMAVRLLSLYLGLLVFRLFLPVLQLPIEFTQPLILGVRILAKILWVVVWIRVVDLVSEYLAMLTDHTENRLDDQFVPLLAKIMKIIIVLIGLMSILRALDVNVTTLIAGVSIGGLALALAAQDTVKNFIGSLMIFVDKPFQVDDYIITPDVEGTVLEVGFRTTRVRKVDTSVIAVPNGQLINTPITNFGVRTARMYQTAVEVVYSTPTHKIKEMTAAVEGFIVSQEGYDPENYIVRFTQMKDSSLSIMIRSYIHVETFAEELKKREQLNMHILELAETLGIELAFPTQTIQISSDASENKKQEDKMT